MPDQTDVAEPPDPVHELDEPADPEPAETAPAKSGPAETAPTASGSSNPTPAGSEPARSAPTGTEPAESAPTGAEPAESAPAKSVPAEAAPANSRSAESAPAGSGFAESAPAGSEPAESAPPPPDSPARAERLRRIRLGVLIAAVSVSVLVVLLVLAAWRNDYLIESDMGETTGEVLSAGRLRSAVMYVTPDGVTHNPKVGVLYPTHLTAGERINVEYNRADPDLVRVAGRDVRVAIPPALSVLATVWALTLPTLWLLLRAETGSMSVRRIFDPVSYRRRAPGSPDPAN